MGAVVGNSFYFDFEVRLMEFLQSTLGEKAISLISHLSALGEETMLVIIIGFIYWCYNKKAGKYIGMNIMMGVVFNPLIKNIFWRRRPYFDHETIKCLRPVDKGADIYDIAAQGFSFPSGHSTNAAAAYGSIARAFKKPLFTVLGFVIPFLVGFSRIVVGCHYPTDVLFGWLLGVLIIFLLPFIFEKIDEKKHWIAYLVIYLICCAGFFYCKTSDYFAGMGLLGGFFGAMVFDDKVVHFENTKNPVFMVTRLVFGLAVFLVLSKVLKMPFSKEFLDSGTFAANLIRYIRYIIISFVAIGLYPMTFKLENKLVKNKKANA